MSNLFLLLSLVILILGVGYIFTLEFYFVTKEKRQNPNLGEKEVRKLVTKKYALGLSRSSLLSSIIAFAVALTAVASLVMTTSEMYLTRIHNELSVRPHLDLVFNDAREAGSGFFLSSNGLGPATVKNISVWVEGEQKSGWKGVVEALFPKRGEVDASFEGLGAGMFIAAGEERVLFLVSDKKSADFLSQNFGKVQISLCYCSIYGETDDTQCWHAEINYPENLPNACDDDAPKGFTSGGN